ncbi:MAG TPA: MFS transporter [Acidimicrobiia bacterium]|nr:MFS transporter [Acidimicrobiia bacterium]
MNHELRPVGAAFLAFGTFAGVWAVTALDVERAFSLTDAQLGFLLAAGIVAATAAAATGGHLVERHGAGFALSRSLGIWGALLVVALSAPMLGVFAPAFIAALAAGGVVDVVMNVVAADVLAHDPGRLVRFHGLFNLAALAGSALAGIALWLHASWRVVWAIVAVTGLLIGVGTRRARAEHTPEDQPPVLRALASLRHDGLIPLATVFALAAMVEGGVATWGILYLRAHLGIGVLGGVGAYVVGQALATTMRMGGGTRIRDARRAVAIGGACAAIGIAAEAISNNALIAATGLAVAATGITVVWPLLIAEVRNQAPRPTLAIGGVTACGYFGMVIGPPIVGVLSGVFNARVGLLFLVAAAAVVAIVPARITSRV